MAVVETLSGTSLATMRKYLSQVRASLSDMPLGSVDRVVNVLVRARELGSRVYVFGNGGSAATASHFACDLSKGAIHPDKGRIRAIALTDNMPLLSAWANDTHYSNVFLQQLENLAEPQDVVIGISGSGNSPNVVEALKWASLRGAVTIGITGFDGGKIVAIVDVPVVVRCHCMEQVEDLHLLIGHVVSTCLRERA